MLPRSLCKKTIYKRHQAKVDRNIYVYIYFSIYIYILYPFCPFNTNPDLCSLFTPASDGDVPACLLSGLVGLDLFPFNWLTRRQTRLESMIGSEGYGTRLWYGRPEADDRFKVLAGLSTPTGHHFDVSTHPHPCLLKSVPADLFWSVRLPPFTHKHTRPHTHARVTSEDVCIRVIGGTVEQMEKREREREWACQAEMRICWWLILNLNIPKMCLR